MVSCIGGQPVGWVERADDGAAPDFFFQYEQHGMRILLAARWCRRREDPQPSCNALVITSTNEVKRNRAGLLDVVAEIIGDLSLHDQPALLGGTVPFVLAVPLGEGNGE
ncbi:hypothetical protein [Sulfobacillus harzensis]|uniref:Uncharacterized protein n=1 Tax=Sulfobacillus harzensis TaxID=2729629 RepID=A0A7Y0L502_9FIRM|nr:hypothetical protein [Sulfobacillus harzensis]NMP23423.1 hypothetical protein [Sulfobacillus harzensis]